MCLKYIKNKQTPTLNYLVVNKTVDCHIARWILRET